jgi:Zinc finger, C3HC4 type (RING finger)
MPCSRFSYDYSTVRCVHNLLDKFLSLGLSAVSKDSSCHVAGKIEKKNRTNNLALTGVCFSIDLSRVLFVLLIGESSRFGFWCKRSCTWYMMPYTVDSSNEVFRSLKDKDRKKKNVGFQKQPHRSHASKIRNGNHSTNHVTGPTPRSPRSPLRSPRALLASVYHAASGSATSSIVGTNTTNALHLVPKETIQWHEEINASILSNQWGTVRALVAQVRNDSHNSMSVDSLDFFEKKGSKVSFWTRISGLRGAGHNSQSTSSGNSCERTRLLSLDDEQRTPLHLILSCRKVPTDIVQEIIGLEPRAVTIPNRRGRLPLHFAIVHRVDISIIAALIDAYPAAMSFPDSKGLSPLQYAVDIAKRDSRNGTSPPRTFWMQLPDFCDEAMWQEEQADRWSVVHWLLLSSATHPQTSLSVGGRKPMLVEALLSAASPAVISLLIGASVMLLTHEKKATAFAGSTLYTCITRHYPLTILMSLASQCPPDVYKVRDETGMGLVSAQFISGCFEQVPDTQEWSVSEDFYACFNECIEEGEIGDDPAIIDWWRKIEFLIARCACSKLNRLGGKSSRKKKNMKERFEPNSFPSEYLLHAALINEDTPPAVIRMLLALYPNSINLRDPKTGALPLHMIAMNRDYIPRYYEVYTTGNDSSLNVVLASDTSAIYKRHEGRLPLHFAIASGRMFASFISLLDVPSFSPLNDEDCITHPMLLQIDPKTGLYPFLLAASYPNTSDEDSRRWTNVARNKYSNSSWKGLSDREKARVILRVAELEDIARIDTIYELLRRQPEAICNVLLQPIRCYPHGITTNSGTVNLLSRDTTGKGVVADHYISWCFTKRIDKTRGVIYDDNLLHQNILRQTIQNLRVSTNLSSLPLEIQTWWAQLLTYIRRIFQEEQRQNGKSEWSKIPYEKHEYLLHAALTISDTPPEIIEMILAVSPESTSLYVPGSSLLPLHIAAQTSSYSPSLFEQHKESSLMLLLNAYPKAARVLSNGRLPLHIAITSGKSHYEIQKLLDAEPLALGIMDCSFGLYPFQLMASCSAYSATLRSKFLFDARNKFNDKTWNDLSPQARTMQVLQTQKEHDLGVLSSIFTLLRYDASILESPAVMIDDSETQASMLQGDDRHSTLLTMVSKASDISGTLTKASEDNSFLEQVKETTLPIARTQNPLPLLLLLSQHRANPPARNVDIYECDASVFSNIDIMSTLTSTIHTDTRNKTRTDRYEDDTSIELEGYSREKDSLAEETSYDDFAEDSFVRSSASYSEGETLAVQEESRSTCGHDTASIQSDDGPIAVFEIRRIPRVSSRKARDGFDGNRSSVKLSKRSAQLYLAEIKTHSLCNKMGPSKAPTDDSLPSNSISKNTSSSKKSCSYKSLRSDEKQRMRSYAEMEWMSSSLRTNKMSRQEGECIVDLEHSSVSLSLPSSHQRFEPATSPPSIPSVSLQCVNPDWKATGVSGKSRKSRSDVGKGRPIDLPGRAYQASQPSLLGAYSDMDTEDDDPLLNLGPNSHDGVVRSLSDHYTVLPSIRLGLGTNQKRCGAIGRSISDHSVNQNQSSFSFGRVRGDGITNNGANRSGYSSTANEVVESTLSSQVKSYDDKSLSTKASTITFVSTVEISGNENVDKNETIIASVNSKYFDKVTMNWKERPAAKDDNATLAICNEAVAAPSIKFFNRATFRWEIRQVVNASHSGCLSSTDALSHSQPPLRTIQNPFSLDMRKSKAAQISKTERHEVVANNSRTQFRGASTRRTQRTMSKNGQLGFMFSSSRNFLVCILCKENERNVLLVPCRHLCLCQSCSDSQQLMVTCPLCACKVTGNMVMV